MDFSESINLLAYELTTQDNLFRGDLKIDLDDELNINNIEGIINESIINLNELDGYSDIPESLKTFKTSFDFSGNKENIQINSFLIDSELKLNFLDRPFNFAEPAILSI